VLERGVVIETEFGSLEGSQAVPASPSGEGEAVFGICSILILKMLQRLLSFHTKRTEQKTKQKNQAGTHR
jgi:hypothetical protein